MTTSNDYEIIHTVHRISLLIDGWFFLIIDFICLFFFNNFQVGGLAVIFDVLCATSVDGDAVGDVDEERSEAAGLLAQITSPWLEPTPAPPSACDADVADADAVAAAGGDAAQPLSAWPTLHLTPYIAPFIAALTGASV